jgi:hypothetical protein
MILNDTYKKKNYDFIYNIVDYNNFISMISIFLI